MVANTISLDQISMHFHIEVELVKDFADFGLYQTVDWNGEIGVEIATLGRLKKIIHLHEALGINKEGIEVILNQCETIACLKQEVEKLGYELKKIKSRLEIPETQVIVVLD